MNKNYRDLTEKTRAEVTCKVVTVETAKKAEATVRLYEMLKLAKGTRDADVINFIMDNQQTSYLVLNSTCVT